MPGLRTSVSRVQSAEATEDRSIQATDDAITRCSLDGALPNTTCVLYNQRQWTQCFARTALFQTDDAIAETDARNNADT